MNYLAHLYLSDHSPQWLVGGLMGDFVKGRLRGKLPASVEAAVRAHRRLDVFTDRDPAARASRGRIDPRFRHLRGILVDVFYDHFLALHWRRYSPEPLDAFTARVYRALAEHQHLFEPPLSWVAPRMAAQDWLGSYASVEGIEELLARMAGRLSRPTPLAEGGAELRRLYPRLEADFAEFLPRACRYAAGLGPTATRTPADSGHT